MQTALGLPGAVLLYFTFQYVKFYIKRLCYTRLVKKALELIFVIVPFIFIAVLVGHMEREHKDLIKKLQPPKGL